MTTPTRQELLEAAAAVTTAECLRLTILLDCLAATLDAHPQVMAAITAVYDAHPQLEPQRWPDGGVVEPWLRQQLLDAAASVTRLHERPADAAGPAAHGGRRCLASTTSACASGSTTTRRRPCSGSVRARPQTTTALRGIGTATPGLLEATGGLDKLAVAAERATASLDQLSAVAGRSTTALATTAAATDGLSRQLNTLDGHLDRASGSLLGFFGSATKYGAAAFAGLTAAAGYFGVTAAASFQQTQASFSTLLGSVTAGQDMFKQLQSFNLETPFGLPELTRSEQTLLQYGLGGSQSFDVLKTLANVAAVGTDPTNDLQRSALALGQISSSGVVRGQDINQLTQAGFPIIRLLQEVTGQSGAQLQQQLQGGGLTLPASDLLAAIASGGGGVLSPYAGAARAQSQTVAGQFSNFKDTLRSDLADASTPLGAQLLQTLPQLTTAVHELLTVAGPPMFGLLGDLLHGFTAMLPVLQPILTGLSSGLHDFLGALGPGARDLVPVGQQLGEAFHELFTDLAGHGDELSHLMVGLVSLLPEMVHILDDLVPLVDLFAQGLSKLLDFGPTRDLMAGLLVTLLGYKALSGTIGAITGMATALRGLAAAEAEEAAAGGLGGVGGASKGRRAATLAEDAAGVAGGASLLGRVGGKLGPLARLGGGRVLGPLGIALTNEHVRDDSDDVANIARQHGLMTTQSLAPSSVIDNSKVADQVIIQGLTQDQATQALLDYNEQRARRK